MRKDEVKRRVLEVMARYPGLSDFDTVNVAQNIADELGEDGSVPAREDALVIVCNKGVHAIDEGKLPAGRVFYASEGNLSMASPQALGLDIEAALIEAAKVLKEQDWRKVYLVPSGLPALAIALSALVYQVKVFPAIVLQYDRETGSYWPMEFQIRRLAAQA